MNLVYAEPVILLAVTAILSLALGLYSWRWRAVPGGYYFSMLMFAVAIFAITAAAELNSIDYAVKILWSKISYFGIVSIPPLWLLLSLDYSQRLERLPFQYKLALWIFPWITLGLVATNEWHGLIWSSITPSSPDPGSSLIYAHGFLFWVHTAYAYILFFLGTYTLLRIAWQAMRIFRRQAVALAICAIIPWTGNLLYLLNINPWPGVDLTPIAFLFAGLGFSWTIYRYQLFDIVPVARGLMFENLADGVFILDLQNRIMDLNPIARQQLGMGDEVIGRTIFEVTRIDPATLQIDEDLPQSQVVLERNQDRRVFDLSISPLRDARGRARGRLVSLHDISIEKRQNAQLTALQSVSQAVASSLEVGQICETVVRMLSDFLGYQFTSIYRLEGDVLLLGAQTGYLPDRIYKQIPLSSGIIGRTVCTRLSQLVPNVTTDADYLCAAPEIRSEICIPLLKGFEVLGTLNIESSDHAPLGETDLRLLTTFANQVVIAMVNASLFQAERDQRELNEALRKVSLALNENLDLESLLDRMLEEIRTVVPYDSASILMVNENNDQASIVRTAGYELSEDKFFRQKTFFQMEITATPNLRKMVETAQPVVIQDTVEDPEWVHFSQYPHARSWAGVPIFIKGRPAAFFALEKLEPGFYQAEHASRLMAFAGQAAIAIENARLHEAEKRKNRGLEALYLTTSMLISTLELDPLLEQIVQAAVNAIPASGKGTLMLVDPGARQLRIHNHVGYSNAEIGQVTFDLDGNGFAVKAVRDRSPILIFDVEKTDFAIYQGSNQDVQKVRSAVVAPLILEGQAQGAISVDSNQPGTFNNEDLQLLVGLASIAATALQNARLHQDVQRLSITDSLTDCYNRRGLFEFGRREISRAQRMQTPLSLLMIDLDHFKHINDTYGHIIGDCVLREVASQIQRGRRGIDIVGRYGGDEFVAILSETGKDGAQLVAENLRTQICSQTFSDFARVTISVGLASLNDETSTLETLIERADHALLHSKLSGRNQVSSEF